LSINTLHFIENIFKWLHAINREIKNKTN